MQDDKLVEDIIEFLDRSVANGVGHLDVQVNETDPNQLEKQVETQGSTDCAKGNLACRIPNLD